MAKPYRAARWRYAMPDPAACLLLSRELQLSPVTAQVLYNRGLTTPQAAQAFLTAGRSQILDPFRLKDMDRAVALIRERLAAGRPIMVYGDYDCDGVTGTTILVLALRRLGATVDYYIPDRFSEGYGLNVGALEELHRRGHDFVLSVDTGSTAVKEAEAARALGMTLVVSDHHELGPDLPAVAALVNPKRPDCDYPFKGLSGVGVAFKLCLALEVPDVWDLLDIVTLGTIADMVPLVGENRAIVREGLAALGTTRRPGLRALMDVAGVKEPITATGIGFGIGPRINALGRMGSAMQGVELLSTDDPARAVELARFLDEQNKSRQEVEQAILQEALRQAEAMPAADKEFVTVLAGEGWHHGVVGICASRVLEAFHRPAVMLAIDGDVARGSARSIPAFHMHRALLQVSDLFSKWGGHAAAAGMTLHRKEDIPELRRRLNQLGAQWLKPEDLVPELRVDTVLTLDQVNGELMAELQRLEPYGIGNPEPVFALKDAQVLDVKAIGKEQNHLKLTIRQGKTAMMEALGWSMWPARPSVNGRIQAAFKPEWNVYQGRSSLRITMKDLQALAGNGPAVQEVSLPAVTAADCLRWDPLNGAAAAPGRPAAVVDARGERLAEALAALTGPAAHLPEVAAAAEAAVADMEQPEPSRQLYIETLAAPAGSQVLVLTASPWTAAALAAALQAALPERRPQIQVWRPGEPEPDPRLITVAPYGAGTPRHAYTDTVLYHPPYDQRQVPGGRVHLLWEQGDWALAEATLTWPYPDRDVLVQLYKLIKGGEASVESLARALGEAPGPWSQLRYQAGLTVFRELGLVNGNGGLNGGKFDLEQSATYKQGQLARTALAEIQGKHWPGSAKAI